MRPVPPNCSLITTTAVTLGGCWAGWWARSVAYTTPHQSQLSGRFVAPALQLVTFLFGLASFSPEYTTQSNRSLTGAPQPLVAFPRLLPTKLTLDPLGEVDVNLLYANQSLSF